MRQAPVENRSEAVAADPWASVRVRTLAVGHSASYTLPTHTHDWSQFIYAVRGVMAVHTAEGSWVTPSGRAVWVPAGVTHEIEMCGAVAMQTLYFSPELHAPLAEQPLPERCCVVGVSPLLRELVLHAIRLGMLRADVPREARLIGVILDQLHALEAVPLDLPLPQDRRALRVAVRLRAAPGDPASPTELGAEAGASRRTLERLFLEETGLTLGEWRRRLRLLHALRLLALDEPVTSVALEAGYESTSAFIAMFRRALGVTPGQYYRD